MLIVGCVDDAYEELSPRQSGRSVARGDGARGSRPTRASTASSHYDQTLPFYLGRTLTLVSYVDEFETGLEGRARPAASRSSTISPRNGCVRATRSL